MCPNDARRRQSNRYDGTRLFLEGFNNVNVLFLYMRKHIVHAVFGMSVGIAFLAYVRENNGAWKALRCG
jgi:hypothetical protein